MRAIGSGIVSVLLGDWLLWGAAPGLSFSFFGGVLLILIWINRPRHLVADPIAWSVSLLFLGALTASAIELCFTNVCVVLVLLGILAGETFFSDRPTGWPRWLSMVGAMLQCPGRYLWAVEHSLRAGFSSPSSFVRVLAWMMGVALPVGILLVIFASILGTGNAVLGAWFSAWLGALWKWIVSFDFSIGRFFLWFFLGMTSLALIRPKIVGKVWWGVTERVRRFPLPEKTGRAFWRSALILVSLNALFLIANGIDAVCLWANRSLPAGVTYAAFVHQGTGQLIAATILAAAVLAWLFNQDEKLTGNPALRIGAL